MTSAAHLLPNTNTNQPSRRRWCNRILVLITAAILLSIGAEIAWAANNSGLPLPRFVSLRKGEVNVRTGPGVRYPVEWVFTYKHMPVEITAEFKVWRKVRDWKGITGWVHRTMLSGKYRWVIVRNKTAALRREAKADAPVIAKLKSKVVGRLTQCCGRWCEVTVGGLQGWIKRNAIWGVHPKEGSK
jgi:SH3-like domain-containing protein